jgi:beta-lactam-binding protein with PASTA domain
MRQFFNIVVGALAMLAVALLSAFLTMRLVIHGREVEIPNVTGLTVAEASKTASALGLNLNLENHFYSTATPAGHVLSQYPAPGTKVRREWVLRITESIGPQIVSVPNVVGQTEREASVTIRRLSLELGTVAYIPAPGPAGVVLAQTPTPAAAGVDGPRISLLVSEPPPAARTRPTPPAPDATTTASASASLTGTPANTDSGPPPDQPTGGEQAHALVATVIPGPPAATADQTEAFVMPNLVGVSLRVAAARVAAMGLSITSVESVAGGVKAIAPITPPSAPGSAMNSATPRPIAPVAPIILPNTVVSQSPAAGRRVTKADPIRVAVSR